ncbi:MAG: DUF2378 family protein [Myxococcus sp.]|nr:DUF2378 family protein [Myxococcus sp.]
MSGFAVTSATPVVFENSMVSLARVLGPALDEDVHQRFLALGVDLRNPNPAYPYEVWVDALTLALKVLWPGVPREEATYRLGRAIVTSFGDTGMGKALLGLVKVLGPHRALERMGRNLRTTNNYSETRLTPAGGNRYELWVNRVVFPDFFRGLVEAGLESGGATAPRVDLLSATPEGVVFAVEWR